STQTFLHEKAPVFGIDVSAVDITDLDAVQQAIRPETVLIYTELLANPSNRVSDIPSLGRIARDNDDLHVVDNTFTSPYLFRPLEHGAHLSLHSASKYISGHGDALAGAIAGPKTLIDRVRHEVEI